MALVVEKTTAGREYKVKDMSRADFVRLEIELAEVEMPELVAYRSKFGPSQPFKGVRITASLHMTIKTAVLIETLTALGAEVRCCCCNIFSTQDHAAAAIARDSAAVFAWKGENLLEYWWCTERALDWGPGGGPDLIVDDGGDATLLIHVGVGAEEIYEKTGTLPDPNLTDNAEFQIVLTIIGDGLKTDSKRYYKMKDRLVGVSEEIATEVKRLHQMQAVDTLLFPTINVNDSVTKSKCDNLYGCRHFLPDGLMRATDVVIAGKIAVVCGYGNVGKGCASALKQAGALVMVTEIDPICALQALLEGIPVRTLEDVISEADIFVNTTGNKDLIMVSDKKKMKNNAIVCNIGHFDNETDMLGLENYLGVKRITIDPQTDSAREQDVINYEYTPIFIRSINKLVEVLLKLLQVMYSSDSSLDMHVIIVMVFIPISFLYMAVAEVVIHVPNKSYCYVIRSIIYVSGVLTCALLLWILFPTFWLIIFLPCCAILFLISICVFQSIRQQIFEFIHDGIYVRLCNT